MVIYAVVVTVAVFRTLLIIVLGTCIFKYSFIAAGGSLYDLLHSNKKIDLNMTIRYVKGIAAGKRQQLIQSAATTVTAIATTAMTMTVTILIIVKSSNLLLFFL